MLNFQIAPGYIRLVSTLKTKAEVRMVLIRNGSGKNRWLDKHKWTALHIWQDQSTQEYWMEIKCLFSIL